MRKIKVLHVITRLIVGGAQVNTVHTVDKLDKARYDAALVSGPTQGPEGEIESEARALGLNLIIIPQLVRELSPLKDLVALFKLYWLIRKEKFDIVHTHCSKAGILGRLAAKLAGVPIIVHTAHGHIFYAYFGWLKTKIFWLLEKLAALFSDKIITIARHLSSELVNFKIGPPDKFITIYSGISFDRFLGLNFDIIKKKKSLGLPPEGPIVGRVTRFVGIKGDEYLLKAIPKVLKVFPKAKFLIIGDGPLRDELINLSQRLKISQSVLFTGLRPDIPELLGIMDLFVSASLNEGMGRVLVEAHAMGKPIVATRVSGVPDVVIDGQTGILVPPKDPDALAKAIIYLLSNPEKAKQMGEAGRKHVLPAFGADVMVKKIEQVYEDLIRQKNLKGS